MEQHLVRLSDDEILLLDGKCGPEVQKVIDAVRARLWLETLLAGTDLSDGQRTSAARILRGAEASGRLSYYHEQHHTCDACDRSLPHPEYKSGPNKGRPNFSKPRLTMPGARFGSEFLCRDCVAKIKPVVLSLLEQRDVPVELVHVPGAETRFFRFENRRCTKCGWHGHQGEMGLLPALVQGMYYGECPSCGAKDLPLSFQRTFDLEPGHVVLPVDQCPNEVRRRKA